SSLKTVVEQLADGHSDVFTAPRTLCLDKVAPSLFESIALKLSVFFRLKFSVLLLKPNTVALKQLSFTFLCPYNLTPGADIVIELMISKRGCYPWILWVRLLSRRYFFVGSFVRRWITFLCKLSLHPFAHPRMS